MTTGQGLEARPQLLTYPDSLGGDLRTLAGLLEGPLSGLFRGVHILPPFPSSGDRGFAPVTYDADRSAVRELGGRGAHRGRLRRAARRDDQPHLASEPRVPSLPTARSGLTVGRPVPDARQGVAGWRATRRGCRPTLPAQARGAVFDRHNRRDRQAGTDMDHVRLGGLGGAGRPRRQRAGHAGADHRLARLAGLTRRPDRPARCRGVRDQEARHDAPSWSSRRSTSSWPGSTGVAATMGLVVLPEVHDRYGTHTRLSEHGHWTYDFVLPGLVLQTFATGDARQLAAHLDGSPAKQFTTLDCHDGIPVRPDLDGILTSPEMQDLTARVEASGGNVNRILSDDEGGWRRRPSTQLHLLLRTLVRRRALRRCSGDPAVREGRSAGLLRRAVGWRERRRRSPADR